MTTDGFYRWWPYGAAARRQPIDFLEGDTVVVAMEDGGPRWKKRIIPFRIDNRAFQLSAGKGWSKAERLSRLLKRVFGLSVQYEFIGEYNWLASADNMYADALSRAEGEARFLRLIARGEFLSPGCVLKRHPHTGRVRMFGKEYSSDSEGDGPVAISPCCGEPFCVVLCRWCGGEVCENCLEPLDPPPMAGDMCDCPPSQREMDRWARAMKLRGGGAVSYSWDDRPVCEGSALRLRGGARNAAGGGVEGTVPYSRASIYVGLPTDGDARRVDELLDNRLAASSMRTVNAALGKWDVVCARYGWPRVIVSDDPARGGKMAAFVLYMLEDLDLISQTIVSYVWGLRSWTKTAEAT